MKRTALIRRKKPWRTWRRPEEDKVSPELAAYIFDRDKVCLQYRVEGAAHQCRERFLGTPHAPDDRKYLRIAHVKPAARLGKRANPDRRELVAECDWANEHWSSSHRAEERAYLAEVER